MVTVVVAASLAELIVSWSSLSCFRNLETKFCHKQTNKQTNTINRETNIYIKQTEIDKQTRCTVGTP